MSINLIIQTLQSNIYNSNVIKTRDVELTR